MKKIRIGKDIHITWEILTNGEPQTLEGRELKLVLTNPLRQMVDVPFSVSENVVEASIYGKSQKHLGIYSLTLWENYGLIGQTAVDACNAFQLVPTTCLEGGANEGLDAESVEISGEMNVGIKGASAYEIAVSNGYKGSEEEWLQSLKQPAEDAASEASVQIETMETLENAVSAAEEQRVLSEQSRSEAENARQAAERQRSETFTQIEGEIESYISNADKVTESAGQAAAQATQSAQLANSAAENAGKAVESANEAARNISVLEQTVGNAEQSRILAEQSRSASEDGRRQAEQERSSAEQSRAQSEAIRERHELDRQMAEQSRAQTFSQLETQATQIVSKSETALDNANQAIQNVNQAAEAVDGRITDIETQIDNMETNGNALTSDIAAGKAIVAEAITNKGVLTSATDSFEKMAENIGQIYKGAYDESFKVKINDTLPSPEVERVGSAYFPNWLEDNIRNVMLKDGVINYYLDRTNSRKRDNGMDAVVDGTDGDVMIILPRFWYSMVFTADGMEITYSNVPQTSEGWKESPEIYVGASEGVMETTGGKDYLRSCYNTTAEFRGGNHGSTNASWDSLTKSLLGMPRTQKSHDAFRTACLNKTNNGLGKYHQFDYRTYVKLLLMYMAVYGTRNIQDEYAGIVLETGEDRRDADGFKYGGLGRGVSDCGAWWNLFNSQNPFVRSDVSYDLGCRSGVVDYPVNTGTDDSPVVQMVKVPVLWGIANPYGHIFKAMDGITKQVVEVDGVKYDRWGLFYEPTKYVSSGQTDADEVVDIKASNSGYIKTMDGNFLPVSVGGSESSYWTDYSWTSTSLSNFPVFSGGHASSGGSCGLASVASDYGVGSAYSVCGGRLCFSPS